MDENLKRKAQKLLNNNGDEFLTQLEATLDVVDKLQEVADAIKSIPETVLPEYPEPIEEVLIANLPEVQKVEITNLPTEKDDKEQLALLKEISLELKKKEQYAYDIEIDPALKEQLKGERGEDGLNGLDGKDGNDGSPDTPQEIVGKLSTLSGEERLDAKYIKNLPETRVTGGGARALSNLYDVNITTPTDGQSLVYDITTQKWKNATVSGGGGISDGDKGDITVSGSGSTWNIDNGAVTLARQADVSTGTVFYRKTAGTGSPEVQTLATLKTDLGLTGTNSGDQTSIVGITGTKAEFNTSVTDGDILYVGDQRDTFGITVDGSGAVLTTGSKGFRYIEQNCTIIGWSVVADTTGSIVFDVKKSGVSIAGTEKPTLSSQQSNSDTSLSTWTTSLSLGDIIELSIDSASTITRATLTIIISK